MQQKRSHFQYQLRLLFTT